MCQPVLPALCWERYHKEGVARVGGSYDAKCRQDDNQLVDTLARHTRQRPQFSC